MIFLLGLPDSEGIQAALEQMGQEMEAAKSRPGNRAAGYLVAN